MWKVKVNKKNAQAEDTGTGSSTGQAISRTISATGAVLTLKSRPNSTSEIAIRLNLGNQRHKFVPTAPMETEIKASLISLLTAIKASDGRTIASEMARLDEYVERRRAGLPPQLVHFLENRSYAKALMYLGGETNIPAGACGGRPAKIK